MKKLATLVAAIALFAASSVASAADHLWFSYVSSSPNIEIAPGPNNGPGQQLHLIKTNSDPAVVTVNINITSDSGALAGWELGLQTSLGSSFANGVAGGAAYDQIFGGIADGANSVSFGRGSSSAAGTTGVIYTFDLVINGGPVLPVAVTGDFGATQGVVKSNAYYWYGFVGNNPISYGAPNYTFGPDETPGWGLNPVVLVTPEPATLVLLGLGAVALIRRRK